MTIFSRYLMWIVFSLCCKMHAAQEVLIVIDMQEKYCEGLDGLVKNVVDEIDRSLTNGNYVFIVTMDEKWPHAGPLRQEMSDLIETRPKSESESESKRIRKFSKIHPDGSLEILRTIEKEIGLENIRRMRVCGVYTEACVCATVCGLLEHICINKLSIPILVLASLCAAGPDSEIDKICGSYSRDRHRKALEYMSSFEGVTICEGRTAEPSLPSNDDS